MFKSQEVNGLIKDYVRNKSYLLRALLVILPQVSLIATTL